MTRDIETLLDYARDVEEARARVNDCQEAHPWDAGYRGLSQLRHALCVGVGPRL